jgi:hypothetical protein
MARRKLWEVSPAYLCPLVGTCLSMPALRRLARRVGLEGASHMSDYELHHAAVRLAAERNAFSRLAHKDLDARFAAALERFAQADDEAALAALWKRALENGELAGALWALMTHPLAPAALLQLASAPRRRPRGKPPPPAAASRRRRPRRLRGRRDEPRCVLHREALLQTVRQALRAAAPREPRFACECAWRFGRRSLVDGLRRHAAASGGMTSQRPQIRVDFIAPPPRGLRAKPKAC